MTHENHGTQRESQVRDMAARLGVADFVYSAPPVRKVNGQRESSGYGLLLAGERGAILQVKARDPTRGVSDSAERSTAWIKKHAAKAAEQGLGTRRELTRRQAIGSPMTVFPVRAASLPAETRRRYEFQVRQAFGEWPVIVILDHPQMPEVDLGFRPGVVWFTFSDWWELQRRLRSISGSLDYVHRILCDGVHVHLGNEAARYAALREADEISALGSPTAFPYLAGTDSFDALGTDIFHDVIDKVWPDDGIIPWQSAEEYRGIVEFLDAVPPQLQSIVGRWILRKRSEIAKGQRVSSGLIDLEFRDRLVFACSHFRHWNDAHEWFREFTLLTNLRHIQALESGTADSTRTLGIAVLVEDRGAKTAVSYSFVMLIGRQAAIAIPDDLRRNFEWRYGVHDHAAGTTLEPKIEPGDRCPCLSGESFASCCGKEAGGAQDNS